MKSANLSEENFKILNLSLGMLIWNIGGLAEITSITAKGISVVDNAAYCCFKTKFGNSDSTMSGSIRANRLVIKDGYLGDSSTMQFLPNHKASDFITTK